MSIWKKVKPGQEPDLEDHAYEKTLIDSTSNLLIFIDGTKMDWRKKNRKSGYHSSSFNSNDGIVLTKKEIGMMYRKMKEGAVMRIYSCDHLNISAVKNDFKHDNNMVKVGLNSFRPKHLIDK